MEYSITQALYEWMHKRRIVSEVAEEMRIDISTLCAKLRPTVTYARLSAEQLVPLCDAIRRVGYGKELDGILHRYIQSLQGEEPVKAGSAAMMTHVLALGKGMSVLLECADRIPRIDDPEELRRLSLLVRTEMLPVVLQMEDLLDRRLRKVCKTKRVATATPSAEIESPPTV